MSKFFELIENWRAARTSMVNASGSVDATAVASARVIVPAMSLATLVADTKWTEVQQAVQTWKYACQAVEEANRPLEEGNATSMEVRLFDEACSDQESAAFALARAVSKLNLI